MVLPVPACLQDTAEGAEAVVTEYLRIVKALFQGAGLTKLICVEACRVEMHMQQRHNAFEFFTLNDSSTDAHGPTHPIGMG